MEFFASGSSSSNEEDENEEKKGHEKEKEKDQPPSSTKNEMDEEMTMRCEVRGPEPGYVSTPIIFCSLGERYIYVIYKI